MKRNNLITSYLKILPMKKNNTGTTFNDDLIISETSEKCNLESKEDDDSDCYVVEETKTSKSTESQNSLKNVDKSPYIPNMVNNLNDETDIPNDGLDESFLSVSQIENENNPCDQNEISTPILPVSPLKIVPDSTTSFFINLVKSFLTKTHLHYLFEDDEIEMIKSLLNLNLHTQILFARMYWLKTKWYDAPKIIDKYLSLNYRTKFAKDIIEILSNSGFLEDGKEIELDDLMTTLSYPLLLKAASHVNHIAFPKSFKKNKKEFINTVNKLCLAKKSIPSHFGSKLNEKAGFKEKLIQRLILRYGPFLKIHSKSRGVFDKVHMLMYMGANPDILREKKVNLLLLNVLAGQYFPSMDLELDSPTCIYPSRIHFLEYYRAKKLFEEFLESNHNQERVISLAKECHCHFKKICSKDDFLNWKPPLWLHSFTPGYCYVKTMEMSMSAFKASKEKSNYRDAVSILNTLLEQTTFRQHKRAHWYTQLIIILDKLRLIPESVEILILALKEQDINEDEKAPLCDRAKRLSSHKTIKLDTGIRDLLNQLSKQKYDEIPSVRIYGKSLQDNAPGHKSKYRITNRITGDTTYASVEEYAIMHYICNCHYDKGFHWEGAIINSIFALLFWKIIYCSIETGKGIFISEYQDLPLDMYTKAFYENRKDKIDEHLIFIKTSTLETIIQYMEQIFIARKPGDLSIYRSNIEWHHLVEVVTCLGVSGVHAICKRLAVNYHYCHSGFPDITVWNMETKKLKFVEVKGQRDKLSFKQLQWIKYLTEANIDTEVCYIHQNPETKKLGKVSNTINTKEGERLSTDIPSDTTNIVDDENELISNKRRSKDTNKVVKKRKYIKKKKTNQESDINCENDDDPSTIKGNKTIVAVENRIDNKKVTENDRCVSTKNTVESDEDSDCELVFWDTVDKTASSRSEPNKDQLYSEQKEEVDSDSSDSCQLVICDPVSKEDDALSILEKPSKIDKDPKHCDASSGKNNEAISTTTDCDSDCELVIVCDCIDNDKDLPVKTAISTLPSNGLNGSITNIPKCVTPTKQSTNKSIPTISNESPSVSQTNEDLPKLSTFSTPTKIATTPSKIQSSPQGMYLRSPNKISNGVGYFVSPVSSPRSDSKFDKSPYKNASPKRKISLALTRRRLMDKDK